MFRDERSRRRLDLRKRSWQSREDVSLFRAPDRDELPIERCRELLEDDAPESDQEVEVLRDQAECLARLVVEIFRQRELAGQVRTDRFRAAAGSFCEDEIP